VQTRRSATLLVLVAILLLALTQTGRATSFSALIVFGDSLTDNGNLFTATKAIDLFNPVPQPPNFDGRFSNGPVSSEQLAGLLGVPLFDFAYGGALTGRGDQFDGGTETSVGTDLLPGMQKELLVQLPSALVPDALFLVWGGANDFEAGQPASVAVANIDNIVATLQAEGAQHILVPGLPDLGLTPQFPGDPAATLFSEEFNTGLQTTLPSDVTYFDTAGLFDAIVADPSAYGFTDATTPCLTSAICSNPDQHLFWDDFDPTTAADTILAEQFDAAVIDSSSATPAVPEPSTFVLLGTGILGLVGVRRKLLLTHSNVYLDPQRHVRGVIEMRRPLRMILAVLFMALGVPSSHADSFTPIFTCFTACAATPTAPDVSFPAPLVMDVTWENMVFDFSLPSSSQPTGISGWELVTPAAFSQSGSASFTISPGGTFITVVVPFLFQLDDNNNCLNCHIIEDGTLQFAPAGASSVPEPSSVVLMLAGIGFLLMVVRKRLAHVHHHVPDFPRLLPILFLTLASAARGSAATITFSNTAAITIPASGTAASDIAVTGFSGGSPI
jgi:phospholipase/lecithinase/hemolysin